MNVERGYVLQGFMNNVMLLPVSFALDWLYTVQFRPIRNLDDAVKISQNCHKVLQREQYDRKKSYIFALAIEEMARNTLEQGFKKQKRTNCIEVKVILRAHQKVRLLYRNTARNYNPFDEEENR